MASDSNVDHIRDDVERLGGSVGALLPVANWVELHGFFTPDQLRELAEAIENQYGGKN